MQKRIERYRFLKKQPTFFLNSFFEKKQVFVLFLKKHKNPILNYFYCIMQYHHFKKLHNNNLLYLSWHSTLRVKNLPHLCFCQVLLVNSFQSGNTWQECLQQTEKSHSHTNSAVSRQDYVPALLVQHLHRPRPGVSNTRPTRAFCPARDAVWEFSNN